MLKKVCLPIFLFLNISVSNLFSQNHTELINQYRETCKKYASNADTLFHYSALFLKLDDSVAQYEGYFAKAYAFRNNMVVDSALANFQNALKFANQKDLKSRAIRMSLITAVNSGKNDLALSYAEQMFELANRSKDSLLLAHSYNQRGIIYKENGDLVKAIEDYVSASRIYKNIKNPGIVNAHTNIAIAYNILGQDTVALKWFKKAYKDAKIYKIPSLDIRATNNLANHFKTLKEYDSSEIYFNQLLEKEGQLNNFYKTLLYQNLSELAIHNDELTQAKEYLSIAKPLVLEGTNVERKIQIYSMSAKLKNALKDYDNNIVQLDSAIDLARQYKLPYRLFPLYLRKAEIHKSLEQYQPATLNYELYTNLRDSLQHIQEIGVIQESVAKYELDSREKDMKAFIEREKGLKSNLYIIGGVSVLLLISTFIIYRRYKSTRTKHQSSQKLAEQKTSELQKLQYQLKQQNIHKKIKLKNNKIINCNDLVYVKSNGHYLEYYLENREAPLIERQKFSNIITNLKDCGFIRVHRSYVINTQKVEAVDTDLLQLHQAVKVPFSRTYKQKLKAQNHPLLDL